MDGQVIIRIYVLAVCLGIVHGKIAVTCATGTFGPPTCAGVCHCLDNALCNPKTGSCAGAGGCALGWQSKCCGDRCQTENIALGKSTTGSTSVGMGGSARGVNGIKTGPGGLPNRPGCALSKASDNDGGGFWWQVDLGSTKSISAMVYYNDPSTNCFAAGTDCRPAMDTFAVYVSTTPTTSTTLPGEATLCYQHDPATHDLTAAAFFTIQCGSTLSGQYVIITRSAVRLAVCELEIFVCETGCWGGDCTLPCDGCPGRGCNQITGVSNAACLSCGGETYGPFQNPSDVWLDVTLCTGLKITYEGTRCPDANRITIWFFNAPGLGVNPQFDARFGYGGAFRYQANNVHVIKGWGVEEIFDKTMELVAGQSFVMGFLIRGDSTIEWQIDGSTIGTYEMREGGTVSDIKKIGVVRCAIITKVTFTTIE